MAHNELSKADRNGSANRYSSGITVRFPMSHMSEETIHTEGERIDIREKDGKVYVYDKEEEVKQRYLYQQTTERFPGGSQSRWDAFDSQRTS